MEYKDEILDYIDKNADVLDTDHPWDLVFNALEDFALGKLHSYPTAVYRFMVNELGMPDIADLWDYPIDKDLFTDLWGLSSDGKIPSRLDEYLEWEETMEDDDFYVPWGAIPNAYAVAKDGIDKTGLVLFYWLFWKECGVDEPNMLSYLKDSRKEMYV